MVKFTNISKNKNIVNAVLKVKLCTTIQKKLLKHDLL